MVRDVLWPLTIALATACAAGDRESASSGDDFDGSVPRRDAGSLSADSPTRDDASGKDICSSQRVNSSRLKPDVLIVLDRSLSMRNNPENEDRWTPAVSAIKEVVAQNAERMSFGLMIYPGSIPIAPMTGTDVRCAPGTIEVPVGPMTSTAIDRALDATMLQPTTPTMSTLAAARKHFEAEMVVGDMVQRPPAYVVLVTDGEPNCFMLQDGASQGQLEGSVAEIRALLALGVRTYVLGFSGKNANLVKALDTMAAAGGTSRTTHLGLHDEASTLAAFEEILGKAASCSFALDKPIDRPELVNVELSGKQIRPDAANGFSLGADGKTVTLQGSACSSLQELTVKQVSIQIECEPVRYF